MSTRVPLLVPGARPSGPPLEVRAPWDGMPIAEVETGGDDAVETALATAWRLARDRDSWPDLDERLQVLERTAAILVGQREALALEAAREGGKPLADSRVEVARAIDGVRICIETLRTQAGREVPMGLNAASRGRLALTRLEPIGVVLAFSAFNHPLNLIVHQVVTAVAAGCPVIVKPAEATPLSCMRLVQILREAGVPPDWCQALVTSDLEVAGRLAADPRVAFFSFIGNSGVGWMLRSRLAPGTRCALEHGGVAPVLIEPDADLYDAVPLLAKGGFYHAGQVCVSVQRVFAHRSIALDLAHRLSEAAQAMRVGDPLLPDTNVGPLIRVAEVERVATWVDEARRGGARVVSGGAAIGSRAFAPTVLLDPPAGSRVSTLEVFGPVICVHTVEDLDEGIRRANELPFAFQAAVFGKDLDRVLRATRRLDAAAVMVNDHTAFRVDWMPFGGLQHSGLGVGGIPYSMRDCQVEKLIVVRSPEL